MNIETIGIIILALPTTLLFLLGSMEGLPKFVKDEKVNESLTSCGLYFAYYIVAVIAGLLLRDNYWLVCGAWLFGGFALGYLTERILWEIAPPENFDAWLMKAKNEKRKLDDKIEQSKQQNAQEIEKPSPSLDMDELLVKAFREKGVPKIEIPELRGDLGEVGFAQFLPQLTITDLEIMHKYCHHLAIVWWKTNEGTAICDSCNSPVLKNSGCLVGSSLYCIRCSADLFSAKNLKRDPSFFGQGVLENARKFSSTDSN